MNIEKLRNQTANARATKEACEDTEFNDSTLLKYIDQRIQAAASQGQNKLELNFYYVKKCILGDKYSGPTISEVISHYLNNDFIACKKHWLSPNGNGHTALIISWR